MNIQIMSLTDAGVPNQERLILRAALNENIGRYVIFDTVQTGPGKIRGTPKNAYWFPDRDIRAGDTIILYTKGGQNNQISNSDGTTTFIFYWGKDSTLWGQPESSAALLKVSEWDYQTRS